MPSHDFKLPLVLLASCNVSSACAGPRGDCVVPELVGRRHGQGVCDVNVMTEGGVKGARCLCVHMKLATWRQDSRSRLAVRPQPCYLWNIAFC